MPSPARSQRARSIGSKVRCSSTSPTAKASSAASSMRAASPRRGRSRACFTGRRRASTTPRAPSRSSGRNSGSRELATISSVHSRVSGNPEARLLAICDLGSPISRGRTDVHRFRDHASLAGLRSRFALARPGYELSIKLRRVDGRHFHVLVEKLVGVSTLDVVGLFHLQIFIDQLVVLGHALVVVPAERHRARGLVVHQNGDEMPIVELVLVEQRAVGLNQRLDAGLGRLGAVRERLLRDLHELVGLVVVGLEPSAVRDDGVAIEIHARVLPGEKAHVASKLTREHVVKIEERRGRVDGPGFERDRKSTRLNSSHGYISYAVFCLKKKKKTDRRKQLTSKNLPHA